MWRYWASRRAPNPNPSPQVSTGAFIGYGREHTSRYRLLFGDPGIGARGGDLEGAAVRSFAEFAAIVGECQASGDLPEVPNAGLTGLLHASVHGLIDIEAGGRMRREKGLTGAAEGANLLVDLLSRGGTKK